MRVQHQIHQKNYKSGDGFINRYQRLIKNKVIPYQYEILNDRVEGAEKSHVIQNFINAGNALEGKNNGDGFYGMVFQDSDAAKWLEAAAYTLANFKDDALEKQADELIDLIEKAQDKDGYLNTYFTIKDRDKRYTNLLEGHEMYCSGHMMEAACAYYEATGKDKLLKVMEKNAEHIYDIFVTGKKEGCGGHPEIELALMKMYRLTKNEHCLELAKHFINSRGQNPNFYEKEAQNRDWSVWHSDGKDTSYNQSNMPVRKLKDAEGHAVRAVYLYTGMADLAAETDDKELFNACKTLWDSITKKRMYVTGGIGSTVLGEAFTVDYDLPGDTAYAETCASIGLMFFASKMLENEVKGEYADVMERAFYNTVLAGMQLDGKKFFYVNPLEVVPGISGKAATHKHDLSQRPGWYACACCPPNVARLISSFGKYAYGENKDTAFCHLYAEGTVKFDNGIELHCDTKYPYGFDINYKVVKGNGTLAIRIPDWSSTYKISVNSNDYNANMSDRYIYIPIKENDKIKLSLDDSPYILYASSKIPNLSGMACVCRGPLVYCFEGIDNDGDVLSLSLITSSVSVADFDENLLGGINRIYVNAFRTAETDSLYTKIKPEKTSLKACAVPYYTWGNRGENEMRVWLPAD